MKHTPGLWAIIEGRGANEASDYLIEWAGEEGDGSEICTVDAQWLDPESGKANACLIAAAPELLSLLKEIANGGAKSDSPEMWERVDTAIAKAEGRT